MKAISFLLISEISIKKILIVVPNKLFKLNFRFTKMTNQITQKGDFIEIKFTGYGNGNMFDSNIESDLKQLHPKAKPEKLVVIIGEGQVVTGLDKALENKEIGKEYEVTFSHNEGFGERRKDLIRVVPLAQFTAQKVNPYPGMVLALDNQAVKIIAVSGARVTVDFNNPLSGKEIKYKFTISQKVTDETERVKTVFKLLFGFLPEFEIKETAIAVKFPKGLETFIDPYKEKFKKLLNKDLEFKEMTKEEIEQRRKEMEEREKKHEQDHLHDHEHSHEGHEHSHEGHEHHEHSHESHEHTHAHKQDHSHDNNKH